MFWDDTFNTPSSNTYPSIGVFNGGTVYASEGGGAWDTWGANVFNTAAGLASQIFGAWGPRGTQQIGADGRPIGDGYSPSAINQSQAQIQAAIASQNQLAAANAAGGQNKANSLDGIFNSLTATVSANPMIFAAGAVGLYLLFREPPRRR